MILEVKEIQLDIKARSRHKTKRVIVYSCDTCNAVYEGKYQKQYLSNRKSTYCSHECAAAAKKEGGQIYCNIQAKRDNDTWQAKLASTVFERYGVLNVSLLDSSKQAKRETFFKNNCSTHEQVINLREKRKLGCLKKYGVEHCAKRKETKEKIAKTCMERYGVPNFTQTQEFQKISRDFRTKFHRGYVSVKGNVIHYRSSYEMKFLMACDAMNDVVSVTQDIVISYNDGTKNRKYFADFLVTTVDSFQHLVEVKPQNLIDYGLNPAKFAAARDYVKQHDSMDFHVITENELKTGVFPWHVCL